MKQVTFSDLSDIKQEIYIANHKPYLTPSFLNLKYKGIYRVGSLGKEDALFIVSTAKAAFEAWYSDSIIIDFSDLDYKCGDEMEWVFEIGWNPLQKCHHPLSIIVGDKCSDSLKTLTRDAFNETCVFSFKDALKMVSKKQSIYEECLKKWSASF